MSLSSSEARSPRQYHVGRALRGGERISYRFFLLGPLGWLADPLYCQDTREDIRSVSLARPWFPGRQKTVSLGSHWAPQRLSAEPGGWTPSANLMMPTEEFPQP